MGGFKDLYKGKFKKKKKTFRNFKSTIACIDVDSGIFDPIENPREITYVGVTY